jgi:polysaccharide biosynthesis protein PslH
MHKPRLLAIATTTPCPTTNGYSLRVYHLLEQLATRWEITLVAPARQRSGSADMLASVRDYISVPVGSSWPCMPSQFDAGPLRAAVRRVMAERPPAAVLTWHGAEFLAFDPAFPPTVADRIDCLTLGKWRDLIHPVDWRGRLRTCRTALDLARYERQVVRRLPFTVVVAEDDAALLRQLSGRDTVRVVPNGVVTQTLQDGTEEASLPTVVFSGVLDFCPNVEAARYFAEEIWPAVRDAVPQARFVIAGRRPAASVRALAMRPGVELVTDVPEMRSLIRRAWVAVAPMRCGSGIKNKVLEAWAAAKPVVMTSRATGGLRLDGSAAGLVANEPGRIAELVIRLLCDREERQRLGAAGYQLVGRRHTWPGAADQISALLDSARAAAPRRAVEQAHRERPGALGTVRAVPHSFRFPRETASEYGEDGEGNKIAYL